MKIIEQINNLTEQLRNAQVQQQELNNTITTLKTAHAFISTTTNIESLKFSLELILNSSIEKAEILDPNFDLGEWVLDLLAPPLVESNEETTEPEE